MASDPALLIKCLNDKAMTISFAESCTGGLISEMVTKNPGASSVFMGSVVSYSDRAKMDILGVKESTLREHGAVSPETATEMASGVKRIFGTDLAISVTGIAGPSGATVTKPVGLVYIGIASSSGVRALELRLDGNRNDIQKAAADAVIDELMEMVG